MRETIAVSMVLTGDTRNTFLLVLIFHEPKW